MNVWEIWFAEFPYEEDPTIIKKRPVIILNIEPVQVLSIKVTSHDVRVEDKYDVPITEWQNAGLMKPSVARVSKAMNLDKSKFDRKIGVLCNSDKLTIFAKYQEFVNNIN